MSRRNSRARPMSTLGGLSSRDDVPSSSSTPTPTTPPLEDDSPQIPFDVVREMSRQSKCLDQAGNDLSRIGGPDVGDSEVHSGGARSCRDHPQTDPPWTANTQGRGDAGGVRPAPSNWMSRSHCRREDRGGGLDGKAAVSERGSQRKLTLPVDERDRRRTHLFGVRTDRPSPRRPEGQAARETLHYVDEASMARNGDGMAARIVTDAVFDAFPGGGAECDAEVAGGRKEALPMPLIAVRRPSRKARCRRTASGLWGSAMRLHRRRTAIPR